ncbi:MAG: PIG-L family deacetylase, partial [Sphingobacteriia bacterium]
MPDALAALGYPVTRIQEDNLTDEMLQDIDVLFVGIRAFNLFEWLTNKNEILNRFVAKGGHLVVQYLKSNQVGNKRVKVGPFPFAMSGVRVTEENAPVTFSQTEHPLVKYPNQLTATDFEDWVQERSTYQMEPVTSPYVGLLQMNDKNDKPTNGSWVTAPYGKGHITYVSLVLFRQLPVANTGA